MRIKDHTKLVDTIRNKCTLIAPVPIEDALFSRVFPTNKHDKFTIAWPHRLEHDKGPDLLVELVLALSGFDFQVVILGQQYAEGDSNAKVRVGIGPSIAFQKYAYTF